MLTQNLNTRRLVRKFKHPLQKCFKGFHFNAFLSRHKVNKVKVSAHIKFLKICFVYLFNWITFHMVFPKYPYTLPILYVCVYVCMYVLRFLCFSFITSTFMVYLCGCGYKRVFVHFCWRISSNPSESHSQICW